MIKISKKIKILISSILISSFISLPFKNVVEVKAIAVIDDAILVAVLGTLAVGAVGTCYSVSNSGLAEKVATSMGDNISDIGNGFVEVYNGAKFANSCIDSIPLYLNAYKSIEGQEYSYSYYSTIENGYSCTYFSKGSIISISVPINSELEIIYNPYGHEQNLRHVTTSDNFYTFLNGNSYRLKCGSNFGSTLCEMTGSTNYSFYFKYKVVGGITEPSKVSSTSIVPVINDDINKPISITLDKTKVEAIASDYIEEYPDDNDDKPDYNQLIPFVFDMLEKELGNGEITPSNLSQNGLVSYYFEDGSTQGRYPYFFEEESSNGNGNGNSIVNNNNNNLTVNNGSDVSEEEKNGILNLLDNGLRSTTERLQSLGVSLTGFKDNVTDLFSFLPDDVVSLFYLAISLSVIFFILSLRR